MNRRVYIIIALVALMGWGLLAILRKDFQEGPNIGSPAPAVSFQDASGKTVTLKDFRGKAVLMNFWATWCGPCRQEMPSLDKLYQKFSGRDFVVLGVSVDEDGWSSINEFLKVIPVSFPIVLDQGEGIDKYEVYRIPETYLIDAEGKIAGKVTGPQDYDQEVFYQKVERLLSRK